MLLVTRINLQTRTLSSPPAIILSEQRMTARTRGMVFLRRQGNMELCVYARRLHPDSMGE